MRSGPFCTRFDNTVVGYFEGKKTNMTPVNSAHKNLADSLQKDIDHINKLEVPDDELCKEFYNDNLKYLQDSQGLVKRYKDVVNYMSKHNPGKDADFLNISVMLKEKSDLEKKLFDKVKSTQKRMAKKFDFTLE